MVTTPLYSNKIKMSLQNKKAKLVEKHIDDWLDEPVVVSDPDMHNLCYAKFVLEFSRMPAFKQSQFKQWTQQFELFCSYEGKRYRVTGASRMGDVWLIANFRRDFGYDLRVDVSKCSEWSPVP